ncbi:hypothetical protein [Methylobacterium sp. J-092]|uniref:hypothetical protein n=1 Tax=Methylobacterium sp. J-092 TaxID=2836667 RepID=UPI001FBBD489|nr:hypothetical protein [Methylobacterium sp. J-092]MCJ2009159.1 hypothetical protein [Methylobacterium sp. J-092]
MAPPDTLNFLLAAILLIENHAAWLIVGGFTHAGDWRLKPDSSRAVFYGDASKEAGVTEFAPTEAREIPAYRGIERFIPPPTHTATQAVSPLDTIADHLLIVHSLMEQHDATSGLREVKAALFKVGRALARGDGSRLQLN